MKNNNMAPKPALSSQNSSSKRDDLSSSNSKKSFKKSLAAKIIFSFVFIAVLIPFYALSRNDKSIRIKSNACDWTYTQQKNKLSGDTYYYAKVESTNELQFKSPYEGGSRFELVVRNMFDTNDVYLLSKNAQFSPSYQFEDSVSITIDNGEIYRLGFNVSDEHIDTLIFFDVPSEFIEKLKMGSFINIEAPFFEAGRKIVSFNIAGLIWEHESYEDEPFDL